MEDDKVVSDTTPSVTDLLAKLAAVEKRLHDLELKSNGTALTEAALSPLTDKAPRSEAGDGKTSVNGEKDEPENESDDPRVKVIVSRIDRETGEPIEEDSKKKAPKENKDQFAFILRKNVYDSNRKAEENDSEIEIISLGLWNLLKKQLGHAPYHMFRGDTPGTLESPYEYLVYYFDELQDAAEQEPTASEEENQARQDLSKLLKVISDGSSGDMKLDKYFKERPSYKEVTLEGKKTPKAINFANLWTVFPPGTLVYGKPFQDQGQVFLVRDSEVLWPSQQNGKDYDPWRLWAWSYDWKDGRFVRTDVTLQFGEFDGRRPLSSLPFAPLDSLDEREADDIKRDLIKRGKIFREIVECKDDGRLFEYSGDAIPEKKGFSGMKFDGDESFYDADTASNNPYDMIRRMMLGSRQNTRPTIPTAKSSSVNGMVMVDYDSYFKYGPAEGRNGALESPNLLPPCTCNSDCQTNQALIERSMAWLDDPKHSQAKTWKDEQYLLCPPRVLGYILLEKRWAQLQVTNLVSVDAKTKQKADKFFSERLHLADDPADLADSGVKRGRKPKKGDSVAATIQTQYSTKFSIHRHDDENEDKLEVDDIIPGKGKGLIILLYGPPGVGKTSTAEVVALATRKPLFSVSVADVGTKAKNVEANLSRIFSLATRWKAILLLDEADVFLEGRSTGRRVQSEEKNALVSVFLRVLEYYQGIMFLTTNNIATFDIAIPSRVHVAIKYDSLNKEQTYAIFSGFINKLRDQGAVDDYDEIMETWFDDNIRKTQFDGRQIRNTVTVALGLARADREDGTGDGKLTQHHLKMAFENVNTFHNDFKLNMEKYKEDQKGMVK
ncbi:AAA family [Apiospora sp. TS-2023a]